jgi:hypothetical protein
MNVLTFVGGQYDHTRTDLTDGRYTANNNSPTNVNTIILELI